MSKTDQHHEKPRPRLPGYAALSPGDIADAKRRRPDVDLRAYAAARSLDFAGSDNVPGYDAALPMDEQLQFNVMSGAIAPGRHGCLFHWVRAWPVRPDGRPGSGTFYGRVWRPPSPPWWKVLRPDLSWLPYVGWLFELRSKPEDGPSYPQAIGVPCTLLATPVPQAAGLPPLLIDNWRKPGLVDACREKLESRGLPGWTLMAEQVPPAGLLDSLLSEPVRRALHEGARHPLYEVRIRAGMLTVCRSGFAKSDEELDGLMEAGRIVADALQDACTGAASA